MNLLYNGCIALSVGIIIGFLCGGIKMRFRPEYSEKKIFFSQKLIVKISGLLKYFTLLLLLLGFVWCIYFLILGFMIPSQAEYATNMSQLIASALTVISIIFAFFEFLRHAKNKDTK